MQTTPHSHVTSHSNILNPPCSSIDRLQHTGVLLPETKILSVVKKNFLNCLNWADLANSGNWANWANIGFELRENSLLSSVSMQAWSRSPWYDELQNLTQRLISEHASSISLFSSYIFTYFPSINKCGDGVKSEAKLPEAEHLTVKLWNLGRLFGSIIFVTLKKSGNNFLATTLRDKLWVLFIEVILPGQWGRRGGREGISQGQLSVHEPRPEQPRYKVSGNLFLMELNRSEPLSVEDHSQRKKFF